MTLRYPALCASSLLLVLACRPRTAPAEPAPAAPVPGAGAAAQAAPTGPAPKLELGESRHHAGTVKQGEPIRHTFVVRNSGLGQLVIEKVQGS